MRIRDSRGGIEMGTVIQLFLGVCLLGINVYFHRNQIMKSEAMKEYQRKQREKELEEERRRQCEGEGIDIY